MSELVSIITPCYNSEKFIEECITSVLNQSYQNWEMLIVDDNSSDNSSIPQLNHFQNKMIELNLFF